jgi:hypothetical protein
MYILHRAMKLTPEENDELKRLLLKAIDRQNEPNSELEPEIRLWNGKDCLPEGTVLVVMPATAQPAQGSAKVHGDKIADRM